MSRLDMLLLLVVVLFALGCGVLAVREYEQASARPAVCRDFPGFCDEQYVLIVVGGPGQ